MKKLVFILSFFLIFFFKPQFTFAETIHSFDVLINAHKNGLMDVAETINYDFEDLAKHGIYRYVPLVTKVGNLYRVIRVENVRVTRDGESENFTFSTTSDKVTFKIGNANNAITGGHIYKIFYTVRNGIGSNYSDHDEIYWNATGNDWQVPIEKAGIKITTDFSASQNNLICFTGAVNSTNKNCKVSNGQTLVTQTLNPGEGLTTVAVYPVNTFPKSILSKEPPKAFGQTLFELILKNYLYIFIVLNFGLGGYLIYWYNQHKNKKRFGKPSVNFDIPKDENGKIIRPALSGAIDTAKLERDDVIATIFDLAIRKYIKLEEVKTIKKFQPDSKEQIILKLKENDGKLNQFEQVLFERLFQDGESVNLGSDLKLDFYKTFQDIENKIFKELVDKKYYIKNPKNQKAGFFFLALLSLFTFNIILAGIFFFLSIKLNGRTVLGDEIDFKIDGLKLFLKNMNRNYKWQAEKFYIVEQMIPYAIALGYIDKFMEQLQIIKPDYNPSWYSGGNFYTNYAIFYAASSSGLITSAPSSSSGAGGGGFSGGGGGGGGGGSW